jgi:hypothetical protein
MCGEVGVGFRHFDTVVWLAMVFISGNPLKCKDFITVFYQAVEINLFCPDMVSILHTVEVKKFASGQQHALGQSKQFGKVVKGICF